MTYFRSKRPRFLCPAVLGFGLLAACGSAQADRAADQPRNRLTTQAWIVPTNKATVLASYYEVLDSNCRPLRSPPIVITARPAIGSLTISTTVGQADSPSQCRYVRVPVTQVLYQAGNRAGTDAFAWEVRFQSRNLGTLRVQGGVTVTASGR